MRCAWARPPCIQCRQGTPDARGWLPASIGSVASEDLAVAQVADGDGDEDEDEDRTQLRLEEGQRFELAAQDLLRVNRQPLLQQGGVDAAEVQVVLQVTAIQISEAGHLPPKATLDPGAREERHATGAVVGTAAGVLSKRGASG